MDRFWAITVALEADVSVAFFETKEMFIQQDVSGAQLSVDGCMFLVGEFCELHKLVGW